MRSHKWYGALELVVKIEHATRFLIGEEELDEWYNLMGCRVKSVRKDVCAYSATTSWAYLDLDVKREIYCYEKYYAV